jgi:hypothetical protein
MVTMSLSVNLSREIGHEVLIGETMSPYRTFLVAISICKVPGYVGTGSKKAFSNVSNVLLRVGSGARCKLSEASK